MVSPVSLLPLEEHDCCLLLLLLLTPFLSLSFFQGHNSLECRTTQIQVDQ